MKNCLKDYSKLLFSFIIISFLFAFTTEIYSASDSLKYIIHSFVKIKTKEGNVIYIDPYSKTDYSDSADVVLITHEHSDHNDLTKICVRKSGVIIRAANALAGGVYKSFTIGSVKVTAVPAYNNYHVKSSCVGYIIDFNGIKIYHPGDTGMIDEFAPLAAEKISYAFIPMDGTYTMTPEVATTAASIIKARVDIPIHTTGATTSYNDAFVARFTSPNKLVVKPGSTIELKATVTGIKKNDLPAEFMLAQNFPNPFNPYTIIGWQTAFSGHVTLKIFNLLGKEVATLVDEFRKAGSYHSPFLPKASLRDNSQLPSGVYYYTLTTSRGTISKKMILLK